MRKNRWFKFDIDAWFAGTKGLTARERGDYVNIIAALYDGDGEIPEDPERLRRILDLRNPADALAAVARLVARGKLTVEGGVIRNRRVSVEVGRKPAASPRLAEGKPEASPRVRGKKLNDSSRDSKNQNQNQNQSQSGGDLFGSPAKAKGHPVPEDFQPDLAEAVRLGLTPEEALRESGNFLDHYRHLVGPKALGKNWPGKWRTWCNNEIKWRAQRAGPFRPPERTVKQQIADGAGEFADHIDAWRTDAQTTPLRPGFGSPDDAEDVLSLPRETRRG